MRSGLAALGSCFDCASIPEIEAALAAGATPERISFGNTIKKERDIAAAYQLGVRLLAVDCIPEVEMIDRAGSGARVFCRLRSEDRSVGKTCVRTGNTRWGQNPK